ncbi:uncharacterized protein K02A2.6-like [Corticium candelabrum]|uniref:uncharacterized protein K02A2.6-like n=1 Tax=Corticium candelabrum TaxID=121492 RepID=UPI002E275922|nr:uncharacterized protein K02A2.6-like [Corticium candelabrum]
MIAERFKFQQRTQRADESVTEYMAQLRRMTEHCKFGDQLDDTLRDRFVAGIRSVAIQRKLLSQDNPSLADALATAQGMEAAENQSGQLRQATGLPNASSEGTSRDVHALMKKSNGAKQGMKACYRCGDKNYRVDKCFHKTKVCNKCNCMGHIAKAWRSSMAKKSEGQSKEKSTHYVDDHLEEASGDGETSDESCMIYAITKKGDGSCVTSLTVNGTDVSFEIDTGSAVTIVSRRVWARDLGKMSLSKSKVQLTTITGESVKVMGECVIRVQHNHQDLSLPLLAMDNNGPLLLGRNWLSCVKIDWPHVNRVASVDQLQQLLTKYEDLFKPGIGSLKGYSASLAVDPKAPPRFHTARGIPYALKESIDEALERMKRLGIIEHVGTTEWASPIVPVPKADGRVRICGDFQVTINPVLEVEQYPLPRPEDLFATLSGGQQFSKLDLECAYVQVELDEKFRSSVTINTHKGLFR